MCEIRLTWSCVRVILYNMHSTSVLCVPRSTLGRQPPESEGSGDKVAGHQDSSSRHKIEAMTPTDFQQPAFFIVRPDAHPPLPSIASARTLPALPPCISLLVCSFARLPASTFGRVALQFENTGAALPCNGLEQLSPPPSFLSACLEQCRLRRADETIPSCRPAVLPSCSPHNRWTLAA